MKDDKNGCSQIIYRVRERKRFIRLRAREEIYQGKRFKNEFEKYLLYIYSEVKYIYKDFKI